MTFINISIRLIIVFMISAMIWLIWDHNQKQPRVFVIHSYNTDLNWVNSIDEGIDQKLKEILPSAKVRHHYMDLQNHNGCNFRRRSTRDVLYGISDWKPDYLLLVDDLAQELVGAHYLAYKDGLFPDKSLAEQLFAKRCPEQDLEFYQSTYVTDAQQLPEIVFAGVNYSVEPYGYFRAMNTQGIYEHKNFTALVETLKDLSQYCGEQRAVGVLPLNDYSATARREKVSFQRFNWYPLELLEPATVRSFDEWKAQVELANQKKAMLVIANYQQVPEKPGSKQYVAPARLIQWTTENARYPVLGAGTNFVDDGGMITVAIAGLEQGKTLVELMKFPAQRKLLEDKDVRRAEQFLVGLAARKLKQYCSNQMPKIYQAYAKQTGLYRYESVSEVLYVEP